MTWLKMSLYKAPSVRPFGLPPRRMSVPLPAIFVAIVTIPGMPACAMICDSASTNSGRALRTSSFLITCHPIHVKRGKRVTHFTGTQERQLESHTSRMRLCWQRGLCIFAALLSVAFDTFGEIQVRVSMTETVQYLQWRICVTGMKPDTNSAKAYSLGACSSACTALKLAQCNNIFPQSCNAQWHPDDVLQKKTLWPVYTQNIEDRESEHNEAEVIHAGQDFPVLLWCSECCSHTSHNARSPNFKSQGGVETKC